jgi:hypothetical protein
LDFENSICELWARVYDLRRDKVKLPRDTAHKYKNIFYNTAIYGRFYEFVNSRTSLYSDHSAGAARISKVRSASLPPGTLTLPVDGRTGPLINSNANSEKWG